MIKKSILSPSKRYKTAEPQDLSININLEEEKSLLREGDKTIILDIAKQFDKERNTSKKYRIYGKINMVFRNLYVGTADTYSPLEERLSYIGDGSDGDYSGYMSYEEFAFLREDYLREVTTTTAGTLGTYNPTYQLSGYTGHTTFTQMDAPFRNWNFYLSYVHGSDPDYPMMYTLTGGTEFNFTASDGIPFRISDEGEYYKLTSPVKHNMSQGEFVILSQGGITGTELERTFPVNSVGNEVFDSKNYVINLFKSTIPSGMVLNDGGVTFGVRCLDKSDIVNTKSVYYVHKHKTLTGIGDYILDRNGFETPIFENERKLLFINSVGVENELVHQNRPETLLYHFKNTLELNGIVNNLGYTPTDVYVTTIFRNGNGYFNYPPKNGYKFHFHNTWVDNHFGMSSSSETNIPSTTTTSNNGTSITVGTELPIGTELTGAFIEYNNREFKETVISESFHKLSVKTSFFNHGQLDPTNLSGVTINNPSGYFYQPHHRVKLRQLSPYVETANTNNILDLPENTNFDESQNTWRWRDLYDHGYVDPDGFGTNFPFLNDQHYVKNDINFYLRNEEGYTNKNDGLTSFNNIDIC